MLMGACLRAWVRACTCAGVLVAVRAAPPRYGSREFTHEEYLLFVALVYALLPAVRGNTSATVPSATGARFSSYDDETGRGGGGGGGGGRRRDTRQRQRPSRFN